MGSTEFVEQDTDRLSKNGVGLLQLRRSRDRARRSARSGTPSLRPFFRDVTKVVASPDGNGTIYDAWRRTSERAIRHAQPEIDDPGGGSDFARSTITWEFRLPSGVSADRRACTILRSILITGPRSSAILVSSITRRWASSARLHSYVSPTPTCIPYDYVEYARAMRALSATAAKNIAAKNWSDVSLQPLDSSITAMERSAARFNAARDAALARTARPSTATLQAG